MIKAIVKNGVVVPRDPLPEDWQEGTVVDVERSATNGPLESSKSEGEALDEWYAELEAIASQGDPEDDERLLKAIQELRQQEKDLARKELGLLE